MKLLTLNLNYDEHKHGDWNVRRDLIIEAIRRVGPDVILLQAVRQDPRHEGGLDQAAQIARAMPEYRHVWFEPAIRHPDGRRDGSAILSRLPWESVEALRLTPPPAAGGPYDDPMPRVVIIMRLAVAPITIVNVHFSWIAAQTESNLDETLAYLGRLPGSKIVAGDFNAPPDARALDRLRRSGWGDAWSTLRGVESGCTFESQAPDKRIDYIWVTNDLQERLRAIGIVKAPRESTARLSDHHGLQADVAVG